MGSLYDKFEDPELRYRQRYVGFSRKRGDKDIFIKRSKVFSSMREYFNSKVIWKWKPDSVIHCRRSSRTSVHYSSQRTGHAAVYAHCQRIVY